MSKKLLIILAVIVLAFGGLLFFAPKKNQSAKIGIWHPSEGAQHFSSLTAPHAPYQSNPPTSGPHYVEPAPWGVSPTVVPPEQYVHNLEHGGIVITYQPTLPKDEIAKLEQVAANLTYNDKQQSSKGFKVLVTPRAANTAPIQLASWQWSLDLQTVDAAKIQQFYRDHLNQSPEPNAM